MLSCVFLAAVPVPSVISGICVDGLKHPAPHIQLWVESRSGKLVWGGMTDGGGRFVADIPPSEFPCKLEYKAPYGAVKTLKLALGTTGLRLSVPQVRIHVIARDEFGKPVRDAKAQGIFYIPAQPAARSGGSSTTSEPVAQMSRFELGESDDLYVDKAYLGSVRGVGSNGDLATSEPTKIDAEGVLPLELRKNAWASLEVDFIDASGKPIKVPPPSLFAEVTGEAVMNSNEADHFRFSRLFPGQEFRLLVEKPDFAVGEDSFGQSGSLDLGKVKAGTKLKRTLQLFPLDTAVGGTVVDAAGNPLKGVAVFSEDPMRYQSWSVIGTATDEKGHFRLTKVARRRMKLLLFPDFRHAFGNKGKLITVEGGKLDNRLTF